MEAAIIAVVDWLLSLLRIWDGNNAVRFASGTVIGAINVVFWKQFTNRCVNIGVDLAVLTLISCYILGLIVLLRRKPAPS